MANHFLVFIGGTGAKCAEAFVHLAACGAIGDPSTTFHVLTLDVDATNGNRELALEAITRYQLLRGQFPATGQFEGSSLFGARIVHYDWHVQLPKDFPHAAGTNCLHAMRTQNSADEEALMRLFYTDEELGFDFSREGFHAIPAIGAPVMQHILTSGQDLGAYQQFVDALRAEVSVNSRLIITGSIFGGTGACGIPAIMRDLCDKTKDISLAGNLIVSGVLLLPYYHFAEPAMGDELGVHARKFYNNARGALAFYRDMEQELQYKSLYLIGSPVDYNMGAYRPGMEGQKNPPTPVEWESALAIAHAMQTEPDDGPPRQYIKSVSGVGKGEIAQQLKYGFGDFSISVQDEIGRMARLIAAYMGYYQGYIDKHRDTERGLKPFFQELIKPYLDMREAESKGLETLAQYFTRYWAWMKSSFTYEMLEQSLFSSRMMRSADYPVKQLHALIPRVSAPRWLQVEDTIFDGIHPPPKDEADYARHAAGLFLHGLYAHCAG